MALTTAQKFAVRAQWGSALSARREPFNLTKAQLDAAITGLDDWIDTNGVQINNAISLPARTILTLAQKVELFFLVAAKRCGG